MKRIISIIYVSALFVFTPLSALAHGFGQRIDLPIPLNFYLIGAGLTVAVSFMLIGLIAHRGSHIDSYPRFNLLKIGWCRALVEGPIFVPALKVFFVLLLLLIVVAGFIGKQGSTFNIAPTFVWILFGVGMTYLSAFIGNIWQVINPWKNIFEVFEKIAGRALSLRIEWPKSFGLWPALILFFAYRWIENVYPDAADPSSLAVVIVAYSVVTFWGMFTFGKENWLKYGDPFAVFFGFLSRFSITESRKVGGKKELNLRPPAVGLFDGVGAGVSQMFFVLFMLSSVAFDGAKVTPVWNVFSLFLLEKVGLSLIIVNSMGLLLLLLIFVTIYLVFSALVRLFARSREKVGTLGYRFVFSLLPIAIVYEVAHFVTLLFVEGQRAIYLISDPFGWGWNLFGTAAYKISYQVINLKSLWHWQVGLIVVGHIIAVYIAHIIAIHLFHDRRRAMVSQYPMLALMVLYTVFSLWIIAQPIVVGLE